MSKCIRCRGEILCEGGGKGIGYICTNPQCLTGGFPFCHNCYVDAGGYLEEITGFQAKLLKMGQNFPPGKKVYKGGIGELCPFCGRSKLKGEGIKLF